MLKNGLWLKGIGKGIYSVKYRSNTYVFYSDFSGVGMCIARSKGDKRVSELRPIDEVYRAGEWGFSFNDNDSNFPPTNIQRI